MTFDDRDRWKRAAALAAAAEVQDDMLVGLGTGTTAAFLIEALGAKVREGLSIRTVATSIASTALAAEHGLAPIAMDDVAAVDLCIDGVDEIDPTFQAIKGGGGAMLREKIVAGAARRMVAIADGSKRVPQLGARSVPLEVLPFARASVVAHVERLGGRSTIRTSRSDQGNLLMDCAFGSIESPPALAAALAAVPGALGHGLFLDEIDALYVGTAAGVTRRERDASVTNV